MNIDLELVKKKLSILWVGILFWYCSVFIAQSYGIWLEKNTYWGFVFFVLTIPGAICYFSLMLDIFKRFSVKVVVVTIIIGFVFSFKMSLLFLLVLPTAYLLFLTGNEYSRKRGR
jgi:hypothetical protein